MDGDGGKLRKALAEARLYVLLATDLCRRSVPETARLAIRGGAEMLQLRAKDKDMPDGEFLKLALELRELTGEFGTIFIINDRPDIAVKAGADGLHIGQEDISVEEARQLLGSDGLIGVSAHNVRQARQAQAHGADYLGIGPIFPTGTKAHARPVGTQLIEQVMGEINIPFFAIGGIDTGNIREVLDAGATRVAVCSAIVSQEDVLGATRALGRELIR